jgi:hypothetical protein
MAAWLDTFTGVLAIGTGADWSEIGVSSEFADWPGYRSRLTAVYCSTSSIDLIFLAFELPSVFHDI